MTVSGWGLIAGYIALITLLAKPAGQWLFAVYEGRPPLARLMGPIERGLYRLGAVDRARDQSWRAYAVAMLVFNLAGILLLYALQRVQGLLPLDPQGFAGVEPNLAFNTAVSFVTNTNWQSYGGESTMSHLVQMAGLTVQNFLSAATGIAVAFALIRGFARREAAGVGNFFADVTRITL